MSPVEEPSDGPADLRRRFGSVLAVLLVVGLYGGMIGAARAARVQPAPAPQMAVAGQAADVEVDRLPAAVAAHYRHAAEHADVYRDVPCYCGCDTFADHAHLLDCFVRPDGGWEPHAAGCGICLAEAEQVHRRLDAGEDSARIRDAIVEQFGPSTNPADPTRPAAPDDPALT